ncbi:MAG: hypothetical protein WC889_12760 [Myxococcota bacterium]|jgi:hypothetical protein
MLPIGTLLDRVAGEVLPDEFQWLVDIGCAGIDTATGNYGGAASLALKAAEDGADGLGAKDVAEGFGAASQTVGLVGGELLNDPSGAAKELAASEGNPIPLNLDPKAKGTILGNTILKAVGAAVGAITGAIAGGAEGAKTGFQNGAQVLSGNGVQCLIGAGGGIGGLVAGGARGGRMQDFKECMAMGRAASGMASTAVTVAVNPEEDKKAIARAAALFGRHGAALGSSVASAAMSDRTGKRIAGAAGGIAESSVSAAAAASGLAMSTNAMETAREAVRLAAAASSICIETQLASVKGAEKERVKLLEKARGITGDSAEIFDRIFDEAIRRGARQRRP